MIKKRLSAAVAAVLTLSAGSALAANPVAVLTIDQSDGKRWVEDVTGLLVVDANGDFTMMQGTGTIGLFQNGQFVTAVDNTNHPDYWQWKTDTTTGPGYWNWHTAETVSSTTDASAPWMSVLNLNNVSGHGDPDLSYAISAVNNNTSTQTSLLPLAKKFYRR